MQKIMKVLMVVLLFAVLAGGSAYFTLTLIVKGEKSVVVPDVSGKDIVYALQLLSDLGLNTKVTGVEYNDAVATDHIIFQKPSAGSEIKRGRDVRLVISKGPRHAVVPRLSGTHLENARAIIDNNGLCLGHISHWYTDDTLSGQVSAQEPPAGASILRSACVNLLVSRGPRPKRILMPRFIGLPVETAILQADQAAISFADIRRERRPDLPRDIVLSHSPAGGYAIMRGALAEVVINGPAEDAASSSSGMTKGSGVIRHRTGPGFLRQRIRLRVASAGVTYDLFDEFVAPGSELWFMVPVTGNSTATLYVDGEPILVKMF